MEYIQRQVNIRGQREEIQVNLNEETHRESRYSVGKAWEHDAKRGKAAKRKRNAIQAYFSIVGASKVVES